MENAVVLPVRILIAAIALASAGAAYAQTRPVHQGGQVTRGHMTMWGNSGLATDAGGALNGHIIGLGITPLAINPLPPFGINDANISNPAGYHQLQISANDPNNDGGQLTYGPIAGATNAPFTVQGGGVLALNSAAQQIELAALPQTVAGDVPVCVNSVTGQLYQASATAQDILLTDENTGAVLTDENNGALLTVIIPADSCDPQ